MREGKWMYIQIEPSNGVPIYEQIVRQVKFAVADGTLVPGQLVPSTRDLARQLAVNPNTIQRAYQQLQAEEVLESLRGRGQAVCQGAVDRCVLQRGDIIKSRLNQVVAEGLSSGLEPEQLRQVFEQALQLAAQSLHSSQSSASDSQGATSESSDDAEGISFQEQS